jgi:hypothetical protein
MLSYRSLLLTAIVPVHLGGVLGCRSTARVVPDELPSDSVPRVALRSALQKQAPALARAIANLDRRGLRVRTEPSLAIPGVLYHWAVYSPPGSGDLLVTAAVATYRGGTVAISTPSDWRQLATLADWQPQSATKAITGCGELVRLTSPARNYVWPAVTYVDSASLTAATPEAAALLRRRLVPPEASTLPGPDRWRVVAWILESGQTVKYTCEMGPSSGSYSASEVISGAGLPRLGP